jgi:hypothetical protein
LDPIFKSFFKEAATFYRGMGEPFLNEVMSGGLRPGHSVSTAQSVADEYAGKSALNIREGSFGATRNRGFVRGVHKLRNLGFDRHGARTLAPSVFKPSGATVKIDVPDSVASTFTRGLPHLGEFVNNSTIPASSISVLRRGVPAGGSIEYAKSHFPASARRLVPKQVRLLEAANRSGTIDQARNLVMNQRRTYDLDSATRLAKVRAQRGLLTSKLRSLAKSPTQV